MSKLYIGCRRRIFYPSARTYRVCTLTLAWRAFGRTPVALAATRDESSDRESEPPRVRGEPNRYIAPRDAEAGGTWIGLTEAGLVAAIANRPLDDDREADRSRGLLVDDCLREPSAEAAMRAVERDVADRAYDGFFLLIADPVAAFVISYDGTPSITRLDPGVHVVGNAGAVINGRERYAIPGRLGSDGTEIADSTRRVAAAVVPEPGESGAGWLDRASGVLADHEYGACRHGDGFGTRSFTRIRTGPAPTVAFADGPPCETPTEPVSVPDGFAGDDLRRDPAE